MGLVRGLQGLCGTLRVEVLSDRPERFAPGSVLFPEGRPEPLTVTWRSADGPGLLLRFREVRSREAAERRFETCGLAARLANRYGVLNEETRDHPDVFVCRGPRQPWPAVWPELRRFG